MFFFSYLCFVNYAHTILRTILPYVALIFAWFVFTPSQAQQELRANDTLWQVVATAGDSYTVRDASNNILFTVDWTIGEIFTTPLHGSNRRVTQGFHQTMLDQVSRFMFSILDIALERGERHFTVFPNPVVDELTIEWAFQEDLNLLFEIYCLSGRRVFYKHQNAESTQLTIQLNHLTPQFYILRVSDPSRGFLETHTILKL